MAARNDGGGSGRKADKIVRDALLAALRQDPERLKRIAEKWWDRAEEEQTALNSLADRLDGKPAQQVTLLGDEENPLNVINKIERVIVRPKD